MSEVVFSGGGKLMGWLERTSQKIAGASRVDVGFLKGATYPDGTFVPTVAAIQEFGDPAHNIPPRPFFRRMIAKESPHWSGDMVELLKGNNFDAKKALAQMGESIKADLQLSINELVEPKLSPATVKRKGFDKPLIETKLMRDSVDYKVVE